MKRLRMIAIAVPTVLLAGTTAAVVVVHRRRKRRRARGFLPKRARNALRELLGLAAADFVPDGLGKTLYQRKLDRMNDRQLLILFAVVKAGSILRARGVTSQELSPSVRSEALDAYRSAMETGAEREAMLSKLGSFGYDALRAVLQLALAALPEREGGQEQPGVA